MNDIIERMRESTGGFAATGTDTRGLMDEAADEIKRLRTALVEIIRVVETNEIPDRHGRMTSACDTTCLNECNTVAKIAIGAHQQTTKSP